MGMLLNEEQDMLRDSAREFLQARSPVSLQRRLRDERVAAGFDAALWREVVELGWPMAAWPEAQGGLGAGYAGLGAVFGQMGRCLAALPLLSSAVLGAELLLQAGSPEQQQRWLPALGEGSQRLALALDGRSGRHGPTAPAV
jgi:alkylation response protein AidB-like acyl-CoA dehydrogenase